MALTVPPTGRTSNVTSIYVFSAASPFFLTDVLTGRSKSSCLSIPLAPIKKPYCDVSRGRSHKPPFCFALLSNGFQNGGHSVISTAHLTMSLYPLFRKPFFGPLPRSVPDDKGFSRQLPNRYLVFQLALMFKHSQLLSRPIAKTGSFLPLSLETPHIAPTSSYRSGSTFNRVSLLFRSRPVASRTCTSGLFDIPYCSRLFCLTFSVYTFWFACIS